MGIEILGKVEIKVNTSKLIEIKLYNILSLLLNKKT